jgi:DNA invertase Pin-like site-specific DNA recombinase
MAGGFCKVLSMTNLLRELSTKTRKTKANKSLVVLYVRVSTDEQKLSPSAQLEELQAYAAKHQLQIAGTFQDVGVSGAAELADCPGLLAAIAKVQEVKAGSLLVVRLDRLARDVRKATMVEVLLDKAGAKLLLVDGSNADDPMAQMTRMFQSWMAQQERALIATRTKAAINELERQNKRFSRHAPYGSAFDEDGNIVDNDQEQAGLKIILDLASKGLGPTAIANKLTDKGFRARTGAKFNAATVYNLVKRHQGEAK